MADALEAVVANAIEQYRLFLPVLKHLGLLSIDTEGRLIWVLERANLAGLTRLTISSSLNVGRQ